jgi:threonine/homoserine/homoserine lactone efflux protein
VVAGSWASIATQFIALQTPAGATVLLAIYEFTIVTIVALIVNRFWTEKLAKVVNLTIAPILIVVGIKFLLSAVR